MRVFEEKKLREVLYFSLVLKEGRWDGIHEEIVEREARTKLGTESKIGVIDKEVGQLTYERWIVTEKS